MIIGFTDAVVAELKNRGATENLFSDLAMVIENIPKKPGLKVDTSDNMLTVLDFPISFLRDYEQDRAWVMTNGEAEMLDIESLKGKNWLFYPNE